MAEDHARLNSNSIPQSRAAQPHLQDLVAMPPVYDASSTMACSCTKVEHSRDRAKDSPGMTQPTSRKCRASCVAFCSVASVRTVT